MSTTTKIYSANEKAEKEISAAEFTLKVNSGTYFLFKSDAAQILYPYTDKNTSYRYTNVNGKERCFVRDSFFALLRRERDYKKLCKIRSTPYHPNFYLFEDEESGLIAMLAPTAENKEIVDYFRRERDNAAKQRERDTRCRLDDGTICKRPCAGCERQGERQSVYLSLDLLIKDGYNPADTTDFISDVEWEMLLDELRSVLTDDELGLLLGLSDGHTLRSYANEYAAAIPQVSVKTLYQRLYRLKPSAFSKAKKVFEVWS